MWKRLAVLIVVILFPVSAVAHTKLYYRKSYTSDYRKIEVTSTPEPMVTPEPTDMPTEVPTAEPTVEPTTPLVEIPLESTLTPEVTTTPTVEITDSEEAEEPSDQITSSTDLSTTP